jgi:hypothetical protein
MRRVFAARAWLCCVAMGAAACGISNEELTAKLRDECQVAPVMPRCCASDEACVEYAYDRFLSVEASQPWTRECLHAVDCSDDDRSGAVHDCLRGNDEARAQAADCLVVCTAQLARCGDGLGPSCNAAVAASCFSDNDDCREACFASL